MIRPFTLAAAALFVGCATAPPPLTTTSPANPAAREGARIPRQTSLRPDDATRTTAALEAAAQKEQDHWDAAGPVSGNPVDASKAR